MFFSKFAERTGLFDILAPVLRNNDNHNRRGKRRDDSGAGTPDNGDGDGAEDGVQDRERIKRRRLDAQIAAEADAERRGLFAKKQRVRYANKTGGSVCDAVICGVHFDDGPDRPYYTIKYKKQCEEELDDGSVMVNIVEIEKQTNPDRLTRVLWDEAASWKILQ